MSLRDMFADEPDRRPNTRCSIAALLDTLNDDDRIVLVEMLADPLVTHTRIARSLRRAGHQVGDYTVGRHRSGGCLCAD